MDEVLFRSSQKIDHLQYQLGIAATEGKKALVTFSGHTKNYIVSSLNSPRSLQLQDAIKELWYYIYSVADEVRCAILYHINPNRFLRKLAIFKGQWTTRDICFGCAGLIIGGLVGIGIGMTCHRNNVYRYMQAVQCTNYYGIEGASLVEDAIAPSTCGINEVLVSVKAGSLQLIDIDICKGYGKNIRKILAKYIQYSKHDLPVTLGRDCAGVVIEIGQNVTRFEIGDEVWLTVPFWAPGTLSQIVVSPEHRVSKKPKRIGFEGACSLPYAGSRAINALNEVKLNKENALDKRVFVQGACTPVGSVVIQLLKAWGAHITTTCFQRARPVASALGANDIIILADSEINTKSALNIQLPEISMNALIKELDLRDKFDAIINTRKCGLNNTEFIEFLNPNGFVISTFDVPPPSDAYDGVMAVIYGAYIRSKCTIQKLFGYELNNFGEQHICHSSLDLLSELVESGHLTTLVDKVYHPPDIETAMYHIQSTKSIGSTVITFR